MKKIKIESSALLAQLASSLFGFAEQKKDAEHLASQSLYRIKNIFIL